MCHVDVHLLDRIAERSVVLAADFNPIDTCNLLVGRTVFEWSMVLWRETNCLLLMSVLHDGTHTGSACSVLLCAGRICTPWVCGGRVHRCHLQRCSTAGPGVWPEGGFW